MRILHTADWHIGHRLYERNRVGEHKQFLDWLLETIKEHEIDVLLVSGDVFDTALPASDVTDLYYRFLFQLYDKTETQAVITASQP
jgi:exonuclease SbcD